MGKVTRRKGKPSHVKRSKKKCRITKNGKKKCNIIIPKKKSKMLTKRQTGKKRARKHKVKGGLVFPSEYFGIKSGQYHKTSKPVKVCVKMI